MKIDSQGGIIYDTQEENKKAEDADLVTLPLHLQKGINCGNCRFFRPVSPPIGHCEHKKVQLPVTPAQCCIYSDVPGMLRNWENQPKSK